MRPNFQGTLSPLPPKMYSAPAIPQDRPCYRILKQCFLDDQMFFEGDIVIWMEEPNCEMEPLNDLAMEESRAFFKLREELGKVASEKRGTLYVALQRPWESRDMSTSESRRVEIVKGDGGIPVMGAKRKPGRPPKAQKLDVVPMESKPISDLTK